MRRLRRTHNLATVAFAVCSLLLAGCPAGSLAAAWPSHAKASQGRAASAPVPPSQITLSPTLTAGPGVAVAMPPVGLSIEYPVIAQDLGSGACPPASLVAELLRLGSPPLQLAGDSQDLVAPGAALTVPPVNWEAATLYPVSSAFWSQLHCLLSASRDPLTVGLNMRTGNVAWASQMVAEAQSAATAGLTVSLGNEPDLYHLPNYASLSKPLPDEGAAAAKLYLQLAAYLRPAVGPLPLLGPELARPVSWQAQLPGVLAQLHPQTVGVHLYPLTTCVSPRAVTLSGLLSSKVAESPKRLAWVVADAQSAGLPAIISEANSASCGGLAGVSDRPVAAVWAVRFVLSALKTGFREVRFHFSGNPYDPFLVRGAEIIARPLESALVALNSWLPVGSSLRTVPGVRELIATAVAGPTGGLTLILDNEHARARPVLLRTISPVRVAALLPSRAGLGGATLNPVHGKLRLTVAANSVLAVSAAP